MIFGLEVEQGLVLKLADAWKELDGAPLNWAEFPSLAGAREQWQRARQTLDQWLKTPLASD